MINAQTKLFAVLGNPLGHSLSPLLQNHYFAQTGQNGIYLALPIEPENLESALKGLHAIGVGGCNVTIPYKETVLPYLKALTPQAEACQAVNTLIPTANGFIGDNTDGAGLLAALAYEQHWQPQGQTIVLIGAGGAAKGIAVALARAGALKIDIINRHPQRAQALSSWLSTVTGVSSEGVGLDALAEPELYQRAQTLINTTSVGMSPHIDEMPPVRVQFLTEEHLVVDIIYNPLESKLLRSARIQGAKTSSGLGMFIHQGALSFERWLGIKPQTAPLYPILQTELQKRKDR